MAVLPLENLSGDASQEYFADGMTDQLIAILGQIKALRVISRTSVMGYKRATKPLPQIARELNVDAVIEGSIARSGERVRITAQLIDAAVDRHCGPRATMATCATRWRFRAGWLAPSPTKSGPPNQGERAALRESADSINPDAYEAYLKGRYFWSKRTADGLRAAIRFFRQAIEIDRNYPEAHSGLADAYALAGDWEYGVLSTTEAFSKATAAASKALELDGTLGEADTSLAFALDLYGWDWDVAATEYEAAIRLNPSYATADHRDAGHLMLMGKTTEALREFKEAQSSDPLSLIIGADIADALCINHDFDAAVAQSRKTLELEFQLCRRPLRAWPGADAARQLRRGDRGIPQGHRDIGPQQRVRFPTSRSRLRRLRPQGRRY